MALDEPARTLPGRRRRARRPRARLRQRAQARARPGASSSARRSCVNIDHHHDNTRFGGREPDRGRGLVDRRDPPRPLRASSASTLTPDDRRGALHRDRHRHGPLPVHEHDSEGPADRRGARRGGRERAPGLPGRLRERRLREAEARSRARSRRRSVYEGGRRDRRRPRAGGLRRGRGGGAVRRGRSSTTCAPSRAPSSSPSSASRPPRTARTRRVSLRTTDDGIDVSAIARKSGGGGHRQAAGFSTDLAGRDRRVHPSRVPRRPRPRASRPAPPED